MSVTPFCAVDPATGVEGVTVELASAQELDDRLVRAGLAFRAWSVAPLPQRVALLDRVAALLRARADELALLMANEVGKPLHEGRAEALKCAWLCEWCAQNAAELLAPHPTPSDASRSEVRAEPLGVVFGVMPWNFPFWQVFRYAAPSLAIGNGVLVKPAPSAPGCALALQALFDDAGAPAGLVQHLFIDVAAPGVLDRVVAHPAVAAVTVTGSERAGRAVAQAAGAALKKVVLELGGSDPVIVLDDADLARAATTAAASRCLNAGQSCIAAKRFIVHERCKDDFLPMLQRALAIQVVGDPRTPGTTVGPLARQDLRAALHAQVQASVQAGATAVLGGQIPDVPGWFYPVTLLVDLSSDMPVWREETFGPVAAVRFARDDDHALELANDTRYGLGAAVWTSSADRAERFARELRTGGVFVNGMVKSDPRLPFGGVGLSGFGRELGREGFYELANVKTVWMA